MFLSLALINFISFLPVASAGCYDIHSTLVTNPDAVPCNNVQGAISMCCDTNRGPSSPYTPDTCLPNGLCHSVFTNRTTGKPDTNYWREGCSDSGWNSQYCLTNICAGSSEVDSNGNAEMTPCDGTSTSAKWCCGTHNTDCCGSGLEIVLAAVLGVAITSSSISSTISTAPTSPTSTSQTSQSSQLQTPTPSPTSTSTPSSLSTGAKAGIGLGSVAVAVLIVGAIMLFFFLKRKKSEPVDGVAGVDAAGYYGYADNAKIEQQSPGMPQAPQYQHQLYEMRGENTPQGWHRDGRGELP